MRDGIKGQTLVLTQAILESFLVISTGCGQIGTLSQAR